MTSVRTILVSACLLGVNCRYDSTSNLIPELSLYLKEHGLVPIPVCPEQLAGLPTPRPKVWFTRGDGAALLNSEAMLINEDGEDCSEIFLKGAQESLRIAQTCGCKAAILKQRSPSCGSLKVHRNGQLVEGMGVTCAVLQDSGIQVVGEDSLEKL